MHTIPSAGTRQLGAGDCLADRFTLIEVVGRGGMGMVFRATDLVTGVVVAVKVTNSGTREASDRFLREARVLSELVHPAVVRYVAHGITPGGEAYLAMEWLDGEDLAARIARGALSISDTLTLANRSAEALALAHARGIVHRDIKPGNLFLVDGDPGGVKILDFGVARVAQATQQLTASGSVLGTFGYMAPEQAYESRDVDARADVYALGCVLFECLTGRSVIQGEQVLALVSKTLLEIPPRVREIRPDVPMMLDQLIARMLAKQPDERPPDGAAVLRELSGVEMARESLPAESAGAATAVAPVISKTELQLVSVLLARLEDSARDATLLPEQAAVVIDRVRKLARRYLGEAIQLPDGTMLVKLVGGSGSAADQAIRAASCAVELRTAHPSAVVAVATGFANTSGRLPLGEVIDRAAGMLCGPRRNLTTVDGVTANLIETRFEVDEVDDDSGVRVLRAPRKNEEQVRTLLGRPTPTVGREKEIAQLLAELDQCIEERTPCAVLVTGPPGMGKSRLRHELLSRLHHSGSVRAVVARADSVSAGSAFVTARQIARQLLGTSLFDVPEVLHQALADRLATRIAAEEARLVLEFLSELLGSPIRDEPSTILRAARGDPRLMVEWQKRSFERWLKLEAREPLLLVIEDMHWADLPTLTYLDNLLKEPNLPLIVLGLARPEVHDVFPRLWAGKLHEIPLAGLGKRAAGQLVRAVLGDIDPLALERLVTRAEGNAFYLEELIRAVAEGHHETLPVTVLAMAQARIEQLDPSARRLLRAASVFGERFWISGVMAIIGARADVASWLAVLERQEVVERIGNERFKDEPEYAFRHGLMRDAAYATLTAGDKLAAHRGAAAWLESVGERDPLIMADQLERAGQPDRAVHWLIRAAAAAYDGGDPVAARTLARRGLADATGEELGRLKMLEGASAGFLGDYAAGIAASRTAVELLPKGSDRWLMAISNQQYFGFLSGNPTAVSELVDAFTDLPPASLAGGLYAASLVRIVFTLAQGGRPQETDIFLRRIEATLAAASEPDPSFVAWWSIAKVYRNVFTPDGDTSIVIASARAALAQFERLGDSNATPVACLWLGVGMVMVGRYTEAAATAATALQLARTGNAVIMTQSEMLGYYARALATNSEEDLQLLDRFRATKNPFFRGTAFAMAAHVHLLRGDAGKALELAEAGVGQGGPYVDATALAVLANALVAAGRPADALGAVARAEACQTQAPIYPMLTALAHAEALLALDRVEDARVALRAARDRILHTAQALTDAEDRASWLNAHANVRLLALSSQWERPR